MKSKCSKNVFDLSTICTTLTHCASSPPPPLPSLCAQRLSCDASPTPSDRTDPIQAEPDVTQAHVHMILMATDDTNEI